MIRISVSLFICLATRISQKLHIQISPNFLHITCGQWCSPRGSCLASRSLFSLSWSRQPTASVLPWYPTKCLGLGSPSLFLAWPQLVLEVSTSVLLEVLVHELVTFPGFVVYLMHLASMFSILIVVVGGSHYYYMIYWFYVTSPFSFSCIWIFLRPQSPSALPWPRGGCLCLVLALFPTFTASASPRQFCLSFCLKMHGLHHCVRP